MSSPEKYLHPRPWVENINRDGKMPKPRCSLDFVINPSSGQLDDDFIRIEQFSGQESISQPFEYKVELRADDTTESSDSKNAPLEFSNIIGSTATIRLGLPMTPEDSELTYPNSKTVVFFNGVISSFSFKQSGVYECVLRPKLWRLGLSNDYCLYTDMTIKELIRHIVEDKHGVKCNVDALEGEADYRSQDWLQAGESDLDFVTQLLGKISGYYYFLHDDTSHKVVFANKQAYTNIPEDGNNGGDKCIPLFYTFSKGQTLDEDDRLLDFTYEQHLVPQGSRNIVAQPDAAWQSEKVAALTVHDHASPTVHDHASQAKYAFNHYRVYQYGVTQKEAEDLNAREEGIIESNAFRLNGQSTCPKLKPGHMFCTKQYKTDEVGSEHEALLDDPRDDVALMRPALEGQHFVVLSAQHQANVAGSYSNSFTAASATGHVLEHNPQKNRMGSVYGRVVNKVNKDGSVEPSHSHGMMDAENFLYDTKDFHFSDKHTVHSCKGVFVKFPGLVFSTDPVWIKLAEHMQSIPEVGTTVLVGRSSDDTEVPEIQSVVQQKGNKTILPPKETGEYGTTQNTSVGNNYSTSYGDSFSIRYGARSTVNLDDAIAHLEEKKKKKSLIEEIAEAFDSVRSFFTSGTPGEKTKLDIDDYRFKDLSYSLGASYSYSAPDKAGDKSGILNESLSYGYSNSEHHGNSRSIRCGANSAIDVIKANQLLDDRQAEKVSDTPTYKDVSYSLGASYSYSAPDKPDDKSGLLSQSVSYGGSISEQYGNSRGIRCGADSKIELSAANSLLDTQQETKKFKDVSYSLGGSYSYSAPDTPDDKIGLLSQSVSYGSTKSEQHADRQESKSYIGTSDTINEVDISLSNNYTKLSNSFSKTIASFSESMTGADTSANVTGFKTSMSATGVATTIDATVYPVNISTSGFAGVNIRKGALKVADEEAELRLKTIEGNIVTVSTTLINAIEAKL